MIKMRYEFTADRDTTVGDLLKSCSVSRRLTSKLKRAEGGITICGKPARTIDPVKCGDIVVISLCDKVCLPPDMSLSVKTVFEDESLIIFDKPGGMPVHPSAKHRNDTLGNFFAARFPGLTFRPVNRLDKNTSGLCVVAKDPFSAAVLQKSIDKTYYAAAGGSITEAGIIDLPIAREQSSIIIRCVRSDGRRAVTIYKPLAHSEKYTLLKIKLETGRTHQIRVHFSHIGHPLAGDDLYGGDCSDISRQALHCGEITFIHPLTHTPMSFSSPLPDDIRKLFTDVKQAGYT